MNSREKYPRLAEVAKAWAILSDDRGEISGDIERILDEMDEVIVLKTPDEWSRELGITIMDPDGWRMSDAPSWITPITYDEYMRRMSMSSCIRVKHD